MDERLKERVAVITGASSGLGKATALRFANSGARIIIADLSSSGVEDQIAAQHGEASALFVKTDVTQESEVQNLIQRAVEFGGRVDILTNFAGVAFESKHKPMKGMHELPTEDFDQTWAIHVRGSWLCCKYAVAQMLRQEPRQPNARGERTRGWVLNTSSVYGLVGAAELPAYVPAKHAVIGMTKQMAANYAKDRIHVNAVCPGFTKTPMIDNVTSNVDTEGRVTERHPWQALGEPDDIADAALFLCSDEASWITGHSLAVDGGYSIV